MKKKILFIMPNLNCGGAEKALISLLETLDFSIYDVDLYLFKHEGLFFNKIPKEVNILPEQNGFYLFDMPFKKAIKKSFENKDYKSIIARIGAGYIFKTEQNRARCEQRVWRYMSTTFNKIKKEYDIAIGYLEKNSIFFCVDKVSAKRKLGFIHNDYIQLGMDPKIDCKYFEKLDFLVTVSEQCSEVLKQNFPKYVNKIEVMQNIISESMIQKMSLENINTNTECINIVTIGRLTYQKGYDLAIKTCKELVEKGFNVVWKVIGEGEERLNLEKMIKENNLENSFLLIGIKENPYPYIRHADIYVQTSRFEGKSIAIDEAKILHKPIVVTNFSTVKDQILHNHNGLIVEMNFKAIAKGIEKLIIEEELRKKIILALTKENNGTEHEIEKFYKLIEAN
ncbi:glycosyltransferase [Metabacillus idriensis]|uniref:glycosyltransferase n=1 Tax=Metabacillus idriensis TaxID=324768 RepID=UPI003D2E32D5